MLLMGRIARGFLSIFVAIILSILLVACDDVDEIKSDEKAEAKTGDNATPAASEVDEEEEDEEEDSDEEEDTDDIWTYFDDATYEDDFAGLVTRIDKVVTTDEG